MHVWKPPPASLAEVLLSDGAPLCLAAPLLPPPCRVAVGDTLIDCASVLGGGRMLQLLVEPLLELSKQVGALFCCVPFELACAAPRALPTAAAPRGAAAAPAPSASRARGLLALNPKPSLPLLPP